MGEGLLLLMWFVSPLSVNRYQLNANSCVHSSRTIEMEIVMAERYPLSLIRYSLIVNRYAVVLVLHLEIFLYFVPPGLR
jgi:hypothetical protein